VANLAAIGLIAVAWLCSGLGLTAGFPLVCLGMVAGWLVLVPVHEGAHALAYRSLGADAITLRYQWRRLTAMCAADRVVIDKRGLVLVALAPLVVVTPLVALFAWFLPDAWSVLSAGATLLHVSACSGDVAMVNWLWLTGRPDVYSYDDVPAGRTHFFFPADYPSSA
jgi:hypothetical protein